PCVPTERSTLSLPAALPISTEQIVTLSANAFVPADLTIDAGTTVRWEVDVGAHTVTPDNASQQGAWQGTGTLNPDDSFEFTFNQAGQTYDYHCIFHQATGMTGRIVVQCWVAFMSGVRAVPRTPRR